MGQRSKVELLPDALLRELHDMFLKGRFSGYDALVKWLAGKGYSISKSALHRYGSKYEQRMEQLVLATKQAQALVKAAPDDEGAMNDALMRLMQEKIFAILRDVDVDPSRINVASLGRTIAQLTRSSITQKRYEQEFREKVSRAADDAASIAKKGGASAEAVERLKRSILNITKQPPKDEPDPELVPA